jgi:hypothetical protein
MDEIKAILSAQADRAAATAATGDFAVTPATGIASIALTMAMKYHDMATVKDGTLYQQYKLEGRNIQNFGLTDVFETAAQIEQHLLDFRDRIAKIIFDAITEEPEQAPDPGPCEE